VPVQTAPDNTRIATLTNRYFLAVALQGVMQIVTMSLWPGSQQESDNRTRAIPTLAS
jgi:hypothetical protein